MAAESQVSRVPGLVRLVQALLALQAALSLFSLVLYLRSTPVWWQLLVATRQALGSDVLSAARQPGTGLSMFDRYVSADSVAATVLGVGVPVVAMMALAGLSILAARPSRRVYYAIGVVEIAALILAGLSLLGLPLVVGLLALTRPVRTFYGQLAATPTGNG